MASVSPTNCRNRNKEKQDQNVVRAGRDLITRGGLNEHDNKRCSKIFQKDIYRKELCGNSSPP